MATAGNVNSSAMKIYTGGTPAAITCLVDTELNMNMEMRDITCKDDAENVNKLPGLTSWDMSFSGMLAFDATNGFSALFTIWKNRTQTAVVWQNAVTGDKKYSGNAYLTNLKGSAQGTNQSTTFSGAWEGVGVLTEAAIA